MASMCFKGQSRVLCILIYLVWLLFIVFVSVPSSGGVFVLPKCQAQRVTLGAHATFICLSLHLKCSFCYNESFT